LYTPTVRRLAAESGIDPATVTGTGVGSRVTKQDMERAIRERTQRPQPVAASAPPGTAAYEVASSSSSQHGQGRYEVTADGDEVVPITRLRRTIAERMVHSTRTVPHAWTTVEVDVTSLVQWRESIKEEFRRREGFNLTYLPF